ncbi:MAG TPA: dTMP kinase [Symbiobacteriaceae bacterium]
MTVSVALFLTFEGMDGSGKTTQLKLLLEYLESRGIDFVFTREPGGTPLAERIRELLLDPAHAGMSVVAEALLFAAGRTDHVNRVIRPALEAGKVVICDRFVDSSLVYQGYAGGLPLEFLIQINEMATGALKPHRTIVLDIDPVLALQRKNGEAADRIEQKDLWFHQQVREGYRELARMEPRRIKLVDASGPVEEVQRRIRSLVDEVLPARSASRLQRGT